MLSSSHSVTAAQLSQYCAKLAPETQFPCNRMMSQATAWASFKRIFNNQAALPSLQCGAANPSKTAERVMCNDCYAELRHQQDRSIEEIPLRGSVADIEAQAALDKQNDRNRFQRFYDNHPTASKIMMGVALGGVVVAAIGAAVGSTVAGSAVAGNRDSQKSQNTNETCLAEYGKLFYADKDNNCVARPALPSDCHSDYQYFSHNSGVCKSIDDLYCKRINQVFSEGKCRPKTDEEAKCNDNEIYVEAQEICRTKVASDCDSLKEIFEGDNCRRLSPLDCTKKGQILDIGEEVCRNLKAEDCTKNGQILSNDGQCRPKTSAEAQCDDSQIYVAENGSCRPKVATDCDAEKEIFEQGNCRSLQNSDCIAKGQTLDIVKGICRAITEADCAQNNQILDNNQCRTRTQQDCDKTHQRLDEWNICQDWTEKDCKQTTKKGFDSSTKQCKAVTAKDCTPLVQQYVSEKQDCEDYTKETCEAEGKKFENVPMLPSVCKDHNLDEDECIANGHNYDLINICRDFTEQDCLLAGKKFDPAQKNCRDFTKADCDSRNQIFDTSTKSCRKWQVADCDAKNQTLKFEPTQDQSRYVVVGCRPWTEEDCNYEGQKLNPSTQVCQPWTKADCEEKNEYFSQVDEACSPYTQETCAEDYKYWDDNACLNDEMLALKFGSCEPTRHPTWLRLKIDNKAAEGIELCFHEHDSKNSTNACKTTCVTAQGNQTTAPMRLEFTSDLTKLTYSAKTTSSGNFLTYSHDSKKELNNYPLFMSKKAFLAADKDRDNHIDTLATVIQCEDGQPLRLDIMTELFAGFTVQMPSVPGILLMDVRIDAKNAWTGNQPAYLIMERIRDGERIKMVEASKIPFRYYDGQKFIGHLKKCDSGFTYSVNDGKHTYSPRYESGYDVNRIGPSQVCISTLMGDHASLLYRIRNTNCL